MLRTSWLAHRLVSARGIGLCAVLALALSLAGCGESKEAKAEKTVCSAKSEIQTKVDSLKNITPSIATLPQIKTEATAIVDDLKKIKGAQSELAPQRKQQTEEAVKAFEDSVRTTVEHISASTSLSSVESQLKVAVTALATNFKSAFAPVHCS